MKKYIFLVILLLLITGCKADYIIKYENNTFDEELIIDKTTIDKLDYQDILESEKDNYFTKTSEGNF